MRPLTDMDYADLDWNRLWQESRRRKTWRRKSSADWDQRAAAFARRNLDSPYIEAFLRLMAPRPDWSVLDVGAGPGTLALPLAGLVSRVTALDFSARMLECLTAEADRRELRNISCVRAAWEDDWEQLGIRPHDVAVASRSLGVEDLRAALEKLDAYGRRAVFIGDRVGAGPFDPEVFRAVGREFKPGPDYIFTINLLYQMGIAVNVSLVTVERQQGFADQQAALDSLAWMIDDPSPAERRRLIDFVAARARVTADNRLVLTGMRPARWAVIWWVKD